jgi:5-methylcytosine-specific restriction endonuclease McrA
MNSDEKSLKELFDLASKIGGKRYNRLTYQDFENYRKYDYWRYVKGDSECGTTSESRAWVRDNSDGYCPICDEKYSAENCRTIDHKLPRSQYPWLSLDFHNFWVICLKCNQEKGEMNWYEYEHYVFTHYPHWYATVKAARPIQSLRSLKE